MAALAEGGDEAKVLAGGQSLVPALNMRILRPSLLVDVNHVAELDTCRGGRGVARGRRRRSARPTRACAHTHCSPRSFPTSATPRPGTAGRSAARSRTRMRRLSSRSRSSLPEGPSCARSAEAGDRYPPTSSSWGRTRRHSRSTSCSSRRPGRPRPTARASPSRSSRSAVATTRSAWPPRVSRDDELRVVVGSVTAEPTVLDVDPDEPGESAAALVEPWGSVHASPAYLRQLVRVLVDRAVARAREQTS